MTPMLAPQQDAAEVVATDHLTTMEVAMIGISALTTPRFMAGPARSFTPAVTGNQVSLGSYRTYEEAQSVVDTLADRRFEVETTQIIGSNLRMVEQITGRQTWATAILTGVSRGVWFGVFIGLLLSILSNTTFLTAILSGVLWGAIFWGAFAAIDYARTAGRRDFTSLSLTVATTFEVLVAADHADRARSSLTGPTDHQ